MYCWHDVLPKAQNRLNDNGMRLIASALGATQIETIVLKEHAFIFSTLDLLCAISMEVSDYWSVWRSTPKWKAIIRIQSK
eukprot:999586-Amphidinium_carterae.1